MKKLILTTAVVLTAISSFSAVTIRYYNKDSRAHTMAVQIDGSKKEVTFSASTTSTVTIQGGGTTCTIQTPCGAITVKDGANIEIKDGCIKIN
ncbi:MAG: hypothetical protein ACOZCO_08430 [Bacteroidota bacterium]